LIASKRAIRYIFKKKKKMMMMMFNNNNNNSLAAIKERVKCKRKRVESSYQIQQQANKKKKVRRGCWTERIELYKRCFFSFYFLLSSRNCCELPLLFSIDKDFARITIPVAAFFFLIVPFRIQRHAR